MATTKVTSSVLADDAVATATIADDAVTTAVGGGGLMEKRIVENALAFLARVDIKGSDAPVLMEVVQALNAAVDMPQAETTTE